MRRVLISFFTILPFMVFIWACSSLKDLEYRQTTNIKLDKLGFSESSLKMKIEYFNPNKYGLILKNATGDMYLENSFLGKFSIDTLIQIPREGNFFIPVTLKVDMKNVFQNSFLALAGKEVTVKVTGACKVGRKGVFFNFPINYEERQLLNFFTP